MSSPDEKLLGLLSKVLLPKDFEKLIEPVTRIIVLHTAKTRDSKWVVAGVEREDAVASKKWKSNCTAGAKFVTEQEAIQDMTRLATKYRGQGKEVRTL